MTDPLFPAREEQAVVVAEIVAAAALLLSEWASGSVQRARLNSCGDKTCGYASCRLADAISAYKAVADEESP